MQTPTNRRLARLASIYGGSLLAGLLIACATPCPSAPRCAPPPASAAGATAGAGVRAMVVGTIHKFHLMQKQYPLAALGELLAGFKPDLVLVEIRPAALAKGHLEDGPFEMTEVTWLARKQGLPVVGIDFWREADLESPAKPDQAQLAAFQRAIAPLVRGLHWPPSLRQVHGAIYERATLRILNARERLVGGSAKWNQRQAWFHHQAWTAIRKRHARRVAAFVGAQHRPELVQYLRSLGARLVNPVDVLETRKADLAALAKRPASPEVVRLWQAGVERMRKRASQTTGRLHGSYLQKIRYFEVAIRRAGRCCVSPAVFRAPPARRAARRPAAPRPPRPKAGPSEAP